MSVKRVENIWKVKHVHVPTKNEFEQDYDYVIIANGHHSKPNMPHFPGQELFKGRLYYFISTLSVLFLYISNLISNNIYFCRNNYP